MTQDDNDDVSLHFQFSMSALQVKQILRHNRLMCHFFGCIWYKWCMHVVCYLWVCVHVGLGCVGCEWLARYFLHALNDVIYCQARQ